MVNNGEIRIKIISKVLTKDFFVEGRRTFRQYFDLFKCLERLIFGLFETM